MCPCVHVCVHMFKKCFQIQSTSRWTSSHASIIQQVELVFYLWKWNFPKVTMRLNTILLWAVRNLQLMVTMNCQVKAGKSLLIIIYYLNYEWDKKHWGGEITCRQIVPVVNQFNVHFHSPNSLSHVTPCHHYEFLCITEILFSFTICSLPLLCFCFFFTITDTQHFLTWLA